MVKLTKGSKMRLEEFDKFVKLRRAYILKLLTKYSKAYRKNGPNPNRSRVMNAMHHNLMNNLRAPKSKYWKKKKGRWECEGCLH